MASLSASRRRFRPKLGRFNVFGVSLLLLAAGACVDLEQVVRVSADGSGELIFNVRFDPKLVDEAIESGQASSKEEVLAEMMKNAAADSESQASTFGEGVRYVGVEEIPGDRPGVRVLYAFDDVTALKLTPFGPLGNQGPAAGAEAEPITFGFEKGRRRSVLTTALFSAEELAEIEREVEPPAPAPEPEGDETGVDQMAKAMEEMMKELFEGLRLAFVIEPVGTIEKTNSSLRDGDRVTLFELDFSTLLEHEEKLSQLGEQQDEPSLAALGRMAKEIEGFQMELLPEVRIEFSGK